MRLNAFFLARASDLSADRSENTALRTFAGKESAADEVGRERSTSTHGRLRKWRRVAPVTVASNEVMTGRSAAVERGAGVETYAPPVGTGALMPAAMITLDQLAASKGQAFDALYKATQINALRQLSAVYNAYSMTGDDAALKQLAKDQLAATDARIAEIARL